MLHQLCVPKDPHCLLNRGYDRKGNKVIFLRTIFICIFYHELEASVMGKQHFETEQWWQIAFQNRGSITWL